MVAGPWHWDSAFMIANFGWRAALAIVFATNAYLFLYWKQLAALKGRMAPAPIEQPDEDAGEPLLLAAPAWVTIVHLGFIVWTVVNAHYPALFIGGFLFFLGFAKATAIYQSRLGLRMPLLVGFFLAGLVIHGGLQEWWIAPVLGNLSRLPLFFGAMLMTAFNDNALITYLATLVPGLDHTLRMAVVAGAVGGGGLTVIANAPNPAGQALLARYFNGSIAPLGLLAGALLPTAIVVLVFALF
jgi:hypothetical protein